LKNYEGAWHLTTVLRSSKLGIASKRPAAPFWTRCSQSENKEMGKSSTGNLKRILPFLLSVVLVLPAVAQLGRDPLTSQEVDALRESRQAPDVRLKLFVKYARDRMDSIERMRNDPRQAADRGPQIHDLLGDLGKIVEEMDDNVDMYADDKFDIRKPLKEVVAADTEFQQKLTALKDSSKSDPALADELRKNYQFVLDDTIEAVNASLDNARQTINDQEAIAKDKTKKDQLRKADQ
jgi:hypothetical protein